MGMSVELNIIPCKDITIVNTDNIIDWYLRSNWISVDRSYQEEFQILIDGIVRTDDCED